MGPCVVARRWPVTLAGPARRMSVFPLPLPSRHASLFGLDCAARWELMATIGEWPRSGNAPLAEPHQIRTASPWADLRSSSPPGLRRGPYTQPPHQGHESPLLPGG
jgi:hypothetical protein